MIRVGFLGYESNYQGGINYLKNLFYAVKQLADPKIEIIAFVGKKDEYQAKVYGKYVKVIKTSLLDRYSILWFVNRFFWRIFKFPLVVDIFCRIYKVDVLSHSNYSSKLLTSKTIQWIPDFQPIVLSHLWNESEVETWKKVYLRHIRKSDKVILSSENAFNDYKSFAPKYIQKASVVHFVSQPSVVSNNIDDTKILTKYKIDKAFFYLPNQFWKHKNHQVVFEAVKILKDKNIDILVVCTGLLKDFRNDDNLHIEQLLTFIEENKLKDNIKTLGMIEYAEVLWFMKNSLAVINPSLFEGWSSTVEEAKSMGQRVVLSDIEVHKEQNPENGIFFKKDSSVDLSAKLEKISSENKFFKVDTVAVEKGLEKRTLDFALNYQNLVLDLV